jgi:hypothetical protein
MIPAVYMSTGLLLAQVYDQQGRSADAGALRQQVVQLGVATRTLDLFAATEQPPPSAFGADAPRGAAIPVRP